MFQIYSFNSLIWERETCVNGLFCLCSTNMVQLNSLVLDTRSVALPPSSSSHNLVVSVLYCPQNFPRSNPSHQRGRMAVISQTTSTSGPPSLATFRSEMSIEDLKEGFELLKEGVECCSALLQSTPISFKDA
jgi:hypothetical protein